MNETIPYLPGLSPVAGKELCARFDGGRLSSDGGVLLFPGIERRLGISDLLASCVTDARDPASTTHTYADMIRARMFAIARNLLAARPGAEVRIVANAGGVRAALDAPDPDTDGYLTLCENTLRNDGLQKPDGIATTEAAVLLIAELQARGWAYMRA